jgi:hypothetical protein
MPLPSAQPQIYKYDEDCSEDENLSQENLSSSSRYKHRLNPVTLTNDLLQKCCSAKQCLTRVNMATMITERQRYSLMTERSKSMWIKNYKDNHKGKRGNFTYKIQHQVCKHFPISICFKLHHFRNAVELLSLNTMVFQIINGIPNLLLEVIHDHLSSVPIPQAGCNLTLIR